MVMHNAKYWTVLSLIVWSLFVVTSFEFKSYPNEIFCNDCRKWLYPKNLSATEAIYATHRHFYFLGNCQFLSIGGHYVCKQIASYMQTNRFLYRRDEIRVPDNELKCIRSSIESYSIDGEQPANTDGMGRF